MNICNFNGEPVTTFVDEGMCKEPDLTKLTFRAL